MGKVNDSDIDEIFDDKKKKMAVWKKILIAIVIIILLVLLSAVIFVNHMLNKINRVDTNLVDVPYTGEEFETDEGATEDTMKPEDVTWPEALPTIESDDEENVINVLLIGQDRRINQGRQRSDSMMIASLNKRDKTVTLTSIMRDSYVRIPGYQDNRVNASYAFGGMSLLDETIALNFGVEIDANVEVDFTGFKTIIDTLGGIDIALKDYEAEYYNMKKNTDKYFVGVNHLTGEEALMYARTRYVGRSDFERTQRQRLIVTTVFNMLKDESPAKIYELINELFPCLTTDMSNSDIIYYSTLIMQMDLKEIQTYRIPADGAYSNQTIRGMMVLVPDLEACRSDLDKIIYGN